MKKIAAAAVVGGILGGVVAQAGPARAQSPAGFTECTVLQALYHPDHAPKMIKQGWRGTVQVPEGWTPVGGSGSNFPGIVVCR